MSLRPMLIASIALTAAVQVGLAATQALRGMDPAVSSNNSVPNENSTAATLVGVVGRSNSSDIEATRNQTKHAQVFSIGSPAEIDPGNDKCSISKSEFPFGYERFRGAYDTELGLKRYVFSTRKYDITAAKPVEYHNWHVVKTCDKYAFHECCINAERNKDDYQIISNGYRPCPWFEKGPCRQYNLVQHVNIFGSMSARIDDPEGYPCDGVHWKFESAPDGKVYLKSGYGNYLGVYDGWFGTGVYMQEPHAPRGAEQEWELWSGNQKCTL